MYQLGIEKVNYSNCCFRLKCTIILSANPSSKGKSNELLAPCLPRRVIEKLMSKRKDFFFVLHRGIGGDIGQDGDFMIFEGSRYRGGFMYKTLAMSAIVSFSYQLFM